AYLPRVLADVLEGKLGALGKRMGHLLFKLSVDQNLMGNVLAAGIDIDLDQLRKVRVRCVKEVKETNGEISFEDAVRYQKGAERSEERRVGKECRCWRWRGVGREKRYRRSSGSKGNRSGIEKRDSRIIVRVGE